MEISDAEGVKIDDRSLVTIAKKGDGSMRDSQSIYDQVVAFCGNEIVYTQLADALHLIDIDFYFRITFDIRDRNFNDIFVLTKEILDKGYDFRNCMQGLMEHFRNLLAVKVSGNRAIVEASDEDFENYKRCAEDFTVSDFVRFLTLCGKADSEMRLASQPRIKFETSLLQLASMGRTLEMSDLLREIAEIRKLASSGKVAITEERRIVEIPASPQQMYVPQVQSQPQVQASAGRVPPGADSVEVAKPRPQQQQSQPQPPQQQQMSASAGNSVSNSNKSAVEHKLTELFNAYKVN